MVLMTFQTEDKKKQCDARCYTGNQAKECTCVCNGENHGIGKEKAIENTRHKYHKYIKIWTKKNGKIIKKWRCLESRQKILFEI